MTAFNAVRFKVKAGREQQFLDAHNKAAFAWPGLIHDAAAVIVQMRIRQRGTNCVPSLTVADFSAVSLRPYREISTVYGHTRCRSGIFGM